MRTTSVSSTDPDWEREKPARGTYEPAKYLLASIRRYQRLVKAGGTIAKVVRPFVVLQHRFWSIVSGADIPLNADIGGGLLMPHPNGIVIHPDAHVGPNCLVFQQVTVGTNGTRPGCPVIAGHVDIGAGAKILGGVKIGAHARIGANAVVLDDVPENASAAGVPARIIRQEPEVS